MNCPCVFDAHSQLPASCLLSQIFILHICDRFSVGRDQFDGCLQVDASVGMLSAARPIQLLADVMLVVQRIPLDES